MNLKSVAVPLAAVIAVVAGWWVGQFMPSGTPVSERLVRVSDSVGSGAPELAGGYVLHPARAIDAFSLTDDQTRPFNQHSLEAQWTFLFMGYTYCPDICSVTMTELAQVHRSIAEQGSTDATPVRSTFVSVDPKRDTLDRLQKYTAYFDEAIGGATGNSRQLEQFARAVRMVYLPAPNKPADSNYLVDHSAQVILTNPKGELQAIFGPPHNGSVMAEDFATIRQWWAEQS